METQKVIVDGKEIELVTKLDEGYDDLVLPDEELEDTLVLDNILEQTQVLSEDNNE